MTEGLELLPMKSTEKITRATANEKVLPRPINGKTEN